MSKAINKVQSDLLNRMQNTRSIACGFTKVSKDVVGEFWSSLVEELNSVRTHIKSVSECKKVWIDQKRCVRSKAAANLKSQRETEGGPNQTKSLPLSEQSIYELIGMKESVEGLENSFTFGLPEVYEGEKNEVAKSSRQLNNEISSEAPTFKTFNSILIRHHTTEKSSEKNGSAIYNHRNTITGKINNC